MTEALGPSVTIGGEVYVTAAPTVLQLEDNGVNRVLIKAVGSYVSVDGKRNSGLTYVVRLEACRGKVDLHLTHSVICEAMDTLLDDLGFALGVNQPSHALIGHTDGLCRDWAPDAVGVHGVLSESEAENHFGNLENGEAAQIGGSHVWWIGARSADYSVVATVKHFNERYPKSLEAAPDGCRIGLLPQLSTVKDSFLPGDQRLDSYSLKQGEARTHELLLHFCPSDFDVELMNQTVTAFHSPLLALAPWAWYADSKALGDLAPRSERYPDYERSVDESLGVMLTRRTTRQLYGDRNFGDDEYTGPGTWNNGEYDYAHVGMLHFLRGEGWDWYEKFARPYAQHLMDIDVCHAGSDKGKIYQHSERHNSENAKLGSHAWLRGLLEYYCFSGDLRAREVAAMVADVWSAGILNGEGLEGTERGVTWPVISMMSMYDTIPEARYLQAAGVTILFVFGLYTRLSPFSMECVYSHCPTSSSQFKRASRFAARTIVSHACSEPVVCAYMMSDSKTGEPITNVPQLSLVVGLDIVPLKSPSSGS